MYGILASSVRDTEALWNIIIFFATLFGIAVGLMVLTVFIRSLPWRCPKCKTLLESETREISREQHGDWYRVYDDVSYVNVDFCSHCGFVKRKGESWQSIENKEDPCFPPTEK